MFVNYLLLLWQNTPIDVKPPDGSLDLLYNILGKSNSRMWQQHALLPERSPIRTDRARHSSVFEKTSNLIWKSLNKKKFLYKIKRKINEFSHFIFTRDKLASFAITKFRGWSTCSDIIFVSKTATQLHLITLRAY